MGAFDAFGYKGKRVLVVGGATGMGAAAAELVLEAGAEVIVADRAPVTLEGVKSLQLDLSDKASIEAAAKEIGGPIDALFSCAGVADGTPGLEKINWVGHRYLVELLLNADGFTKGSAICFIASSAGMGWAPNLPVLKEWLAITDFDEAAQWAVDNNRATYMWTKRAICAFVASEAFEFLKKGIRINAILPGPTDTPLARANADQWLGFGKDYRDQTGITAATALEQAYPLVFLCSPAASAITGITLITDDGYASSATTGSFPAAAPVIQYLLSGA
ncbi:MAG TPA: SDR family oxidoreductase [Jatrophihabitans sp.]|jgi:NAD(P)-dependent dehydrogenase (short-subunit alcohol dehydrogenase family)